MSDSIKSNFSPTNSTAQGSISLAELADDLQCHKAALFKIAKRLDIQPTKRRDSDRRNQLVSFVTIEESDRIRGEYNTNRKTSIEDGANEGTFAGENGVFYVIRLEPDHDPGRIKVGFTTDLEGRLRKHRCSAPFAESLQSWPCRRTWERAALDCVTDGLEQLHTEVFRASSIDEVIDRGTRFFSVMPPIQPVADVYSEEENTA